jgi:hypothetical protein
VSGLPRPDPLCILRVSEIVFVSRLGQPRPLTGSLAGPATIRFGAEALTVPMPVIRKKKLLAVKAFTAALLSLHRFKHSNPSRLTKGQRKKEKNPTGRRLKNQKKEEDFLVNLSKKIQRNKIHF